MVTSSDFYQPRGYYRGGSRQGRAAASGNGVHRGRTVVNLRSCQKLGIPFIGVGHRIEKLENAGAAYTLPDLSPASFWQAMKMVRKLPDRGSRL